ncbi:hypothetical protein Landi51_08956 [Colletotrichum acutatum]
MVASTLTGSSLYERRVVERVHRYQWPGIQLNLWILIMLVAACLIIGVFASFIETQQQLLLPIPWCVIHSALSTSPSHSVMLLYAPGQMAYRASTNARKDEGSQPTDTRRSQC